MTLGFSPNGFTENDATSCLGALSGFNCLVSISSLTDVALCVCCFLGEWMASTRRKEKVVDVVVVQTISDLNVVL